MSVATEADLAGLRAVGAVVAETITAMRAAVRPGVTTAELDAVAAAVFARHGARSGPQLDYDFPGTTCISVGNEAVHGIPGPRRLLDGDLVKLDVTAELDGFYADACRTAIAGRRDTAAVQLVRAAEDALQRALDAARAGVPVNRIGAVVESSVRDDGFEVCRELSGHGIGRRIHEPPDVLNYFEPENDEPLTEGLVMTIEPIISSGSGEVMDGGDGWTVVTADGAPCAHAEDTVVITRGDPLVLTA